MVVYTICIWGEIINKFRKFFESFLLNFKNEPCFSVYAVVPCNMCTVILNITFEEKKNLDKKFKNNLSNRFYSVET